MSNIEQGPLEMEVDDAGSSLIKSFPSYPLYTLTSATLEKPSYNLSIELAQLIHRLIMLTNRLIIPECTRVLGIQDNLEEIVKRSIGEKNLENPALYRRLRSILKWNDKGKYSLTEKELNKMENKNKNILTSLETKVDEAKASAGDMEVFKARWEVAQFSAKSLSKEEAIEAYRKVLKLPKLSNGKKIDALMESSRVACFYDDRETNIEILERISKLVDNTVDWDRRNRLMVYNAISKLQSRDLKSASSLLLKEISTFSCVEMCSYKDFLVYAILCNTLYLSRNELKAKIINTSEIHIISQAIPQISDVVFSLYNCNYNDYLSALVNLEPFLVADRFLQRHAGFILRELHVLGYKQFLDAYKSVTLESMSSIFGIGKDFLDAQLVRFISAGRLSAKIDKVSGVVDTNRPDNKNELYKRIIREGDLLLNRMQKLSKIIDI